MEISNIFLQYLRVVFFWPIITLILVISFISLFKEPISDFFRRLIKGNLAVLKFNQVAQQSKKGKLRTYHGNSLFCFKQNFAVYIVSTLAPI